MKIGCASLVGVEPMPFSEFTGRAKAIGLDSIEINVGPTFTRIGDAHYPGHLDLEAVVNGGTSAVRELLDASSLHVSALAPMLNLLTPDLHLREERIAVMRLTIDACGPIGTDTVVTYAGSAFGMHFQGLPGVSDNHPSNKLGENLKLFKEIYAPLADYAGERGVRIAFETAPRGGGEGNLAHAPGLWDLLFETVDSEALGLSFDPSHLIWLQVANPADVIRAYGHRIYHVDGKDAEILPARLAQQGIFGSSWWRYRLPGQGALDWTAILSALRDIGYDGAIAIENEDPLCLGMAGVEWSANYLRARMLPTP